MINLTLDVADSNSMISAEKASTHSSLEKLRVTVMPKSLYKETGSHQKVQMMKALREFEMQCPKVTDLSFNVYEMD